MLIPEHKIEEVLDRTDLVALISRHVELKKAGRSFKGRCPFHQEKSASFHVTPEMRRFKCFGCQAGGDAIAFVQRYLGKTFVDAVRDLAREAGIDLASAEDPAAKERQQLREANDAAQQHFQARLQDPAAGKVARDYLEERGVSPEMITAFGLGWAPPAWDELTRRLMQLGILDFGVAASLVQKRNRGEGYFDVFRSRLMIPIRSAEGRTIAFGGRLLALDAETEDRGGPKYLNSRESRLYNKSDILYGIDQAREEIRRRKSAVLVEGYFDCIGLHQVGVKHAVALCSTALTPGHLALLARHDVKELVLLLDGDEAGRKAVERLAGALLAQGTAARVALLPEAEDPDTFARRVGQAGVEALIGQAKPLTEHLFEVVLPEGAEASFERKMQALERLKPVTAQLPVGLTRSAFFSALARHTGLPAQELEAELRGKAPAPLQAVPKPGAGPARPAPQGQGARNGYGPPRGNGSQPGYGSHPGNGAQPGYGSPPGNGAQSGYGSHQGSGAHSQYGSRGGRAQGGPSDGSYTQAANASHAGSAAHAQPPSPAPRPVRPPDPLEAAFVAALLRLPRLAAKDSFRVQDELSHPSLRQALARVSQGVHVQDVLEELPEPVQRLLASATSHLPAEEGALERDFRNYTRKLKLRYIDEQLAHISRVTGSAQGEGELTDEVRRLLSERLGLLALKKQVLEEFPPPSVGTKGGGHLV